MKIYLTSSLGYFKKDKDGRRIPAPIFDRNGFLDRVRSEWVSNAKVLIMVAAPYDYVKNDDLCSCYKKSFEMSGLSVAKVECCDARNLGLADSIKDMDVVLLGGGHVPTQNEFFKQTGLKEKLADYNGLVIAWSAGSMNCAEMVYSAPEAPGEALDSEFKRWRSGLGLTQVNIFPHYNNLWDEWLDGLRIMEDITYPDSKVHEIITMNDGTYIVIDENGKHTLYGMANRIKDGVFENICQDGESVVIV